MTEFIHTDNLEWLRQRADNSIDSIVTDAPYGLGKAPDPLLVLRDWIDHGYHEISGAGFMGKKWDAFVPQPIFWRECLRVLKPGGHLLCFFGTRTYDWGVMSIRIAGFEIRDQIAWVYASGFPKSLDVSKAIDKAAGAERKSVGTNPYASRRPNPMKGTAYNYNAHGFDPSKDLNVTEPATDSAKEWDGWGTALKPAMEPIVVARKPLIGTVAKNLQQFGVGALNINASRVPFVDASDRESATFGVQTDITNDGYGSKRPSNGHVYAKDVEANPLGRWPANFIHDGSDEVLHDFPDAPGQMASAKSDGTRKNGQVFGIMNNGTKRPEPRIELNKSASRFFYCAKASPEERNLGTEHLLKKIGSQRSETSGQHITRRDGGAPQLVGNNHPTVKPIALMRYLIRLVTPKDGIVLDPFCGSGTTGIAAELEMIPCICLDNEKDYIEISKARAAAWRLPLFST